VKDTLVQKAIRMDEILVFSAYVRPELSHDASGTKRAAADFCFCSSSGRQIDSFFCSGFILHGRRMRMYLTEGETIFWSL